MNSTVSAVNLNTAAYVSRASSKPAAQAETPAVETPGESVTISDAPAQERRSGSRGLGMIGKAAALIACAAAAAALTGCAVTTGTYGPYGYGTSTVGVTPSGQVYTQETQVTPWGVTQRGTSVGPQGAYIYQNGVPHYWNGHGYYPRTPVCTPMTYWSPGTCY